MGRDVANESASEFSRLNARSRLFGRLRGLHGLCLTPRRPARLCPELSFRMLFSCADTQSRSTCLSAVPHQSSPVVSRARAIVHVVGVASCPRPHQWSPREIATFVSCSVTSG